MPLPLVFRDPTSLGAEAAALRLEIARILVRAPSLPVYLPAFGVSLLDVVPDRTGFRLVIGGPDPAARIHLERAGKPKGLAQLGASSRENAITATIEEVGPDAPKIARQLAIMAARVRDSIDRERWDEARDVAKRLRRLPAGIPLDFFRQLVPGVPSRQGIVRVGFGCNQDCGFCWQDREWDRFDAAQVLTWIEDLAGGGVEILTLSGGEPTLDGQLEAYIRRARELGIPRVTLETNAIQCAKPGYAERLRDAGLTEAFVSFHSGDAAISDAATRAPGTHARTVAGTRALLDAGIPLMLNAVMTSETIDSLPELPDFLHETFGRRPELRALVVSYPTNAFDPALTATLLPDPRKVRVALPRAIERALALGLRMSGLESPGGPPLCAFGADPRVTALLPTPGPVDFRQQIPACEGCTVRHACFGVRDAEVTLFGDVCVEPIRVLPTPRS